MALRTPGTAMLILLAALCCAQQYQHYFGNIHSHTAFSDGNKDSASKGVSTPAGSYSYARSSQDFDFLGISEHNHYSTAHNPGFRRPLYQTGLQMADEENRDGEFLCLFGMEYGVSSDYNGHVLIYGMNQLLGWEQNVPGVSGNNYDVYNAKSDYAGLFAKVNAVPGAIAWLAHPGFDDFAYDGTYKTSIANNPVVPAYDSAIVGMPLRSGLANNGGENYNDYPMGHYFNYYKKMLYCGYHLGIGYDHDNHYTNFGRGNGGRLVVLSSSLTRADLMDAIRAMRFYGSDDQNARVTFTGNGQIMGSIYSSGNFPLLEVQHSDPDGEEADSIKIWKGYAGSGGLWANIVYYNTGNNTLLFTDYDVQAGVEYYYFAEIRQKDGQWIVTSPVWFKGESTLALQAPRQEAGALYENNTSTFYYSGLRAPAQFVVNDLSGRTVYSQTIDSAEGKVCLGALSPGIYVLYLRDGNGERHKRKIMVR